MILKTNLKRNISDLSPKNHFLNSIRFLVLTKNYCDKIILKSDKFFKCDKFISICD